MRIFDNCKEAVTEIARELKKCSSYVHTQTMQNKVIADDENYQTKELEGFSFAIINADDKDEMPGVTLEWCKAELAERLSEDTINPGEAYKLRHEVWDEFLVEKIDHTMLETKIEFDYTYNERINYQLKHIVEELKLHPESRQAIIEIHNNIRDLSSLGGRARIPCSMFYQYMLRDGKLDVIYVMRSTDFQTHFQNDIWQACSIRDYVAKQIGVQPGKFIMFASSLHIYKKDWDALANY